MTPVRFGGRATGVRIVYRREDTRTRSGRKEGTTGSWVRKEHRVRSSVEYGGKVKVRETEGRKERWTG